MWRLGSESHMEMAVFADPPLASPVAEGIMSADINRADMTTVGLFDDMPDNWRDNPQASAGRCVIQNRPCALREMLASGLVELDITSQGILTSKASQTAYLSHLCRRRASGRRRSHSKC